MNLEFGITYRNNPEIVLSIINPASGTSVTRFAYLDTGADVTLLDESIAFDLGLSLEQWHDSSVRGIGNGRSGVQIAEVELHLLESPELSVVVDVVFIPGLAESVGNLVGLDVLSMFDIALSHGRNAGLIGRTF